MIRLLRIYSERVGVFPIGKETFEHKRLIIFSQISGFILLCIKRMPKCFLPYIP